MAKSKSWPFCKGGRRAKPNLGSGEAIKNNHVAVTLWASPNPSSGNGCGFGCGGRLKTGGGVQTGGGQPLPAQGQQLGAAPVSQEAEVANADKAFGQDVEKEAAEELFQRQDHLSLLVVVGGIAPAEDDLTFLQGDEPVIGDGYAMGVATEIAKREDLRSDLLALHGMAHTVIHGAPLTTPPGEETLTEMAASLSLVFSDAAEALRDLARMLDQIADLATD
jgi:hypothetical protein